MADFDLFDYLNGRSYPEEIVPVYTDENRAYILERLKDERDGIRAALKEDGLSDAERKKLDKALKDAAKEAESLAEQIKATALKFHLRGVPQEVIDATYKKYDDKKVNKGDEQAGTRALLGKMIEKVEDPEGNIDNRSYDYEDVLKLKATLPGMSFVHLLRATEHLILASVAFDGVNDSGFFLKS